MKLELSVDQQQRIAQIAAESNLQPEEVALLGVRSYLQHLEDLADAVRDGEASAEREGWLTTDEVFERLYKRLPKTA